MARILPQKSIGEFLTTYRVTELNHSCPATTLTIKVWDLYGTKPQDESAAPGVGQFIAAIVICETCGKHVTLDRRRLENRMPRA